MFLAFSVVRVMLGLLANVSIFFTLCIAEMIHLLAVRLLNCCFVSSGKLLPLILYQDLSLAKWRNLTDLGCSE